MSSIETVAFCGGGSGGHLTPAVAVAEEWLANSPSNSASFLVSSREVDERILASSGLPTDRVTIHQQPIRSSRPRSKFLFGILRSFFLCRRMFRQHRPNVVVGMGGFASVPGVITAWWLGIPVVLLETNTIPGRANRWIDRFAEVSAIGWPWPDQMTTTWRSKLRLTGVPVREEFEDSRPVPNEANSTRLLVLGGSQGARRLNNLVVNALQLLDGSDGPFELLHQCGLAHVDEITSAYEQLAISTQVVAFVDDVADALQNAEIIISRAGAVCLAEIAAVGRASILIPLSSSADQHQQSNADYFESADAAFVLQENDPAAANKLANQIRKLTTSPEVRTRMTAAAQELFTPRAAKLLAEILVEMGTTSR